MLFRTKNRHYTRIMTLEEAVERTKMCVPFIGSTDKGDPIMVKDIPMPIVRCLGYPFIEGLNVTIHYNINSIYYTYDNTDNKYDEGVLKLFNTFMSFHKPMFLKIFKKYNKQFAPKKSPYRTRIEGVFTGRGITDSKLSVGNIDPCIIINNFIIDNKEYLYFLAKKREPYAVDHHIYPAKIFRWYEVNMNIERPFVAKKVFLDLEEESKKKCHIASFFKVKGIGSGFLWRYVYKDIVYSFRI